MTDEARAGVEHDVAGALRRAGIYRLLAGAFSYPTAPRVEELARATATVLVVASGLAGPSPRESRGSDGNAVGVPAGPLRDALAAFAAAAYRGDAAALADEHVFLFDRLVRCPPWESAYGDGPQMAGKSAELADIAGFYAAFGLTPGGSQPDTEDHVVAELEFMSALALKEAWARGEDDAHGVAIVRDAARAFLTDHLGRWAELLADELAQATPLPFYVAAARLLAEWVRTDVAALGAEPRRFAGRLGADPLQEDTFTCPVAERGAEAPPSD